MDKSSELKDLSQAQKIAHLLSLREGGMTIVAISQQYNTPRCTLYYWLCRYETYHTHEDRSPAPHCTHGKVTEEIRMAVLEKHSKNRLLGCWRLSLFLYQEQRLSHTTIWRILVAARQPRPLSQSIYQLTHYHQIWFIDQGQIRLDRKAIQQAARTDGKWVVQTNDDTLKPEDAACAYKGLTVIERCFRTLKRTQLKLEPVHHRLPRRLEAHVKICVMALLIERVAELACEQS